ncbi:IQ DOMAIN-CONTAINING PROTEIN IQM6 [Salix purpurea]|uniref:IQ DOMAIN-CONTAINING PROTEIN IQM6 n=1 Tax=Salix purpurea TaxID=77065 RepID=A0A9Q0UC88_SALPP|nr:IQ DOMAIN-CONTAINING PROTEIN IQM6 [Salix purpurea]
MLNLNYEKINLKQQHRGGVGLNASKVGKGLGKDAKAQKLAFQHWIEAIDPRHRYGHNLNFYYEEWRKADALQPFFYWLDIGDGKEIDLKVCPRIKLCQECIQYLGPVCSRAWKLGEFIIMILCFHSNSALSSPFHTSSAHDKFA